MPRIFVTAKVCWGILFLMYYFVINISVDKITEYSKCYLIIAFDFFFVINF